MVGIGWACTASAPRPTSRSRPHSTPGWVPIAAPSRGICGSGRRARAPPNRRACSAWRGSTASYAHDTDISYGEHGTRNHLDIWRRPDLDRGGKAPVLLQVPGGAWMVGSKRQQAYPLMSHLAELGWVCVAINYRLSPRSTWPDQIVDVKRALAWTKEHIAEYGGDPDWVAITGGSAGGHLSSLAALTPNDPQFQPGFEDADTSVRAAVPFYGLYDFTTDERDPPADGADAVEVRLQAEAARHSSRRSVPRRRSPT